MGTAIQHNKPTRAGQAVDPGRAASLGAPEQDMKPRGIPEAVAPALLDDPERALEKFFPQDPLRHEEYPVSG